MGNDDLVVVFDAVNEVQTILYRSLLEEAGIDVIERPLEIDELAGVKQRDLHSQLLVRQADAAQARELIAAYTEEAELGTLEQDAEEEG